MANTQNPSNKQHMILLVILAITWVFMFIYMKDNKKSAAVQEPDAPVALLQKADKAAESKRWTVAIDGYRDASNKFGKTQHGATASLRLAQTLRDATGTHRTWTGKQAPNRDEHAAIEAYKSLISQYGRTKFPEVKQAEGELLALRIKMDRAESKHWMYAMLDGMVQFGRKIHLGPYSYAFALLLITLLVKLLTWKLSVQQYKGMRDMQRIQPIVKEIQQKYKGDPKTMNSKVMEAYKEHGVNPLMGCLPLLIQMPIMYVIWFAIRRYEFQFENGTFLWINQAMHAQYGTITLFGHQFPFIGANLAQPDIPLVILYALSMFVTQRLTIVDPTQAEQQKIMAYVMPLMLAFFFWSFASAFLLYWLMLNIVMTIHQYHVMKAHEPATSPQVVQSTATSTSSARKRRRRR